MNAKWKKEKRNRDQKTMLSKVIELKRHGSFVTSSEMRLAD
jgi:hypothetical protein